MKIPGDEKTEREEIPREETEESTEEERQRYTHKSIAQCPPGRKGRGVGGLESERETSAKEE